MAATIRNSSATFEHVLNNGFRYGEQTRAPATGEYALSGLLERYPGISVREWVKVMQEYKYNGKIYDLHWFEARDIIENGKVESVIELPFDDKQDDPGDIDEWLKLFGE